MKFGGVEITVLETPGNAVHHHAYIISKILFTGDAGGVRIENGTVLVSTPPTDSVRMGVCFLNVAK